MRLIDESVLQRFRERQKCEFCGASTPNGCDPHHAYGKGFGGGFRIDVPWLLCGICRLCHIRVHGGNITRYAILSVIARREGVEIASIQSAAFLLRRADRDWTPLQWSIEMAGLSDEAAGLVRQAIGETVAK